MKSDEEGILIENIIGTLEEVSNRSESLHPRRAISLLGSRLSLIMSSNRYFDLLNSVLLVQFLRNLFDEYFDQKIGILSMNELDKSSMSEEIKSMFKREFQGLTIRDHFDGDYILMFSDLKEDMTTLSQVTELIGGEGYEKQIVECISRSTDKILEDLKENQLKLFQTVLNEVKKKRSLKALEGSIVECIKEMHIKIWGWP